LIPSLLMIQIDVANLLSRTNQFLFKKAAL
jgi:hypothetical protein